MRKWGFRYRNYSTHWILHSAIAFTLVFLLKLGTEVRFSLADKGILAVESIKLNRTDGILSLQKSIGGGGYTKRRHRRQKNQWPRQQLSSNGEAPELARRKAHSVCWNGPGYDWGGVPLGNAKRRTRRRLLPAGPQHIIFIAGTGCTGCIVGHTCSFLLRFASNVYFTTNDTAHREMMGTLFGPSLAHVSIIPHPSHRRSDGTTFLVSYQVWDAGKYTFVLDGDCTPDGSGSSTPRRLISLSLQIANVTADESDEFTKLITPPRPCTYGQYGRWFHTGKGQIRRRRRKLSAGVPPPENSRGYEFVAYPCAGELTKAANFAHIMLRKGIREISFVGDSHQRSLFTHLQTLIEGSFSGVLHADRVWDIWDPLLSQKLRLNFYWMEGVFRDGEYGCVRKNGPIMDAWPVYSSTSDVVILDAAAWTFRFCEDPIKAYTQHLPEFLQWILDAPHKQNAKFFWRTSPPFPSHRFGCSGFVGKRLNSNFMWANDFARSLATSYGMDFMDFWPIEAPKYLDTCLHEVMPGVWHKDTHYSCLYANKTKVYGQVGEAVLSTFMHVLANA